MLIGAAQCVDVLKTPSLLRLSLQDAHNVQNRVPSRVTRVGNDVNAAARRGTVTVGNHIVTWLKDVKIYKGHTGSLATCIYFGWVTVCSRGDQLRLPWMFWGDRFWRGIIDGVTDRVRLFCGC